ncbi:MAG: helix-turn-helix domain-containing protein [Lentisphaeria bacterium]|nr:helix-turn-helix domain-containing protein [Lentisphaeria bacterium]
MKTEQEKAELVSLYRAGTPVQTLCERFGVCKSTAYNWIKKFSPIKRTSCTSEIRFFGLYPMKKGGRSPDRQVAG